MLVLPAIAALWVVEPAGACPNCKEETQVKQEESGIAVAAGYSLSVVFMLGVPFAMVGGFGYALYRNTQAAQTATAGDPSDDCRSSP